MIIGSFLWPDVRSRKEASTLDARVQELMELSHKRAIIRFIGNEIQGFIISTPRNYSFIILFTSDSRLSQCDVCKEAYEEFYSVANSYRFSKAYYSWELFFGMVDIDHSPDVFKYFNINSVPAIVHFPGKGKPKDKDRMDIQEIGLQAETVGKWIAERTDFEIRVFRLPKYAGIIAVFMFCLLIFTLLFVRCRFAFLWNSTFWSVCFVSWVVVALSGVMFHFNLRPPFMHTSIRGDFGYIHKGNNSQFMTEFYIVLVLHVAVIMGIFMLNKAGAAREDNAIKRRNLCIIGLSLAVVCYSLLITVASMKIERYPHGFPFIQKT